ncbi:hypothetical protein GCM10010106_51250 [Thermopolyspora flexuosa]|nr:hypothetical protein GCM10010106_51250 [Thermopolyspora flexuosa]
MGTTNPTNNINTTKNTSNNYKTSGTTPSHTHIYNDIPLYLPPLS